MARHDKAQGIAWDWYAMITEQRAALGWTLEQLEERSGVSRAAVNNLKYGKRPPRPDTVHALATALGIPVDDALRASRGELSDETQYADESERILSTLPGASDEEREALLQIHRLFSGRDQQKRSRPG